jgi:amino acid adenylation domain-containing protein
MPLMPNGKIDFRALATIAGPVDKADGKYEEPRNTTERALQEIFEETLERKRVGIRDSFFEIGGHSILATITVARMRQKFGIPIAIRVLFDHPTIAELHDALSGQLADSTAETSDTESPDQLPAGVPKRADAATGRLSPMQTALWYLSELDADRGAYNLQCGFRLCGRLDREKIEQAIHEVVNSHPALRSEIVADTEGQPYARIHDQVVVPFEYLDLRNSAGREREFLDRVAVRPVATDRAPLLRVSLAHTNDDEYLLVLVFHHLVVEGWSVATLLHEVGEVYADLQAGNTAKLEPEPIDYWDWNEYEAERLSASTLAPQISYWKRQLAGKAPRLELARRGHSGAVRGGMIGRPLSAEVVRRLEFLAKEHGATLFMILLGAYQVLLHRYTGESDIRVGVPINTRTRPELERTAGLFINTLVLRSQVTPDLGFERLLGSVKNDVLDAFSNMDAPLEAVARSLDEDASTTSRELFQAMFALQNVPSLALELPDISSTPLQHDELHSGAGKVDVSLVIEPGDRDYQAWIEFDGHAFDRERAERLLRHFDVLLNSIVEQPSEKIGRLDILPADERRILLESFNSTDCAYDERVAVSRVWEQVGKQPDSPAVSNAGESLTYQELGLDAARVVQAVLAAGHPAGSVIAVCMRRSANLVATLVGSHLAGCCYVPVDPEYPDERIEYIVNDSGAVMLVTDMPGRFDKLAIRPAIVDSSSIGKLDPADPGSFRWPANGDLAYIVYTSGSTGVPKGVRLAQQGLSNLVAWELKTYGITQEDRMSMLAGLGFDATVWEVWPCLAAGAALYEIDDDIRANPTAVYDWLAKHRITVTFLPTPLAEVVLDLPAPEGIALRYLFTGGDVLHARQWPRLPFPVVNHYGPSENTVIATAGVVLPDLPPDVPPNIGKPIDNTRTYILDEALQLVPIGVVGELCLAGIAVSCGYVNQDERSADRFVANPYARGCWARMYRTGDRAYYNADGTIEFLGRMDEQVKIRGFRIELGDIEATLTSHPAVANAAVRVWNVSRDDQRLAAYIVPAQGQEGVDSVSLRKFVRRYLPSYMVPTYFTAMTSLPLTSNGKTDRKALPLPATEEKPRVQDHPATATEIAIADIWKKTLHTEYVDRNANFFEIGGNSISAMKVVSEVSACIGVPLPLRAVVMDTLAQIASFCDETSGAMATKKADGGLQTLLARVFRSRTMYRK